MPLSAEDREIIVKGIHLLQTHVHEMARSKGFWEGERNMGEQIALVHSELSEALEAARTGNGPSEKIPAFSGVEEEFADAVIRLCDMCGGRAFRLGEAILAKVDYNAARPYKHGKKF